VCDPASGCLCPNSSKPKTNKAAAIGVTAGLAALLALLIIGFVVAALFAQKKAKALATTGNAQSQNFVSSNPLYEASGANMDNPMYVPPE